MDGWWVGRWVANGQPEPATRNALKNYVLSTEKHSFEFYKCMALLVIGCSNGNMFAHRSERFCLPLRTQKCKAGSFGGWWAEVVKWMVGDADSKQMMINSWIMESNLLKTLRAFKENSIDPETFHQQFTLNVKLNNICYQKRFSEKVIKLTKASLKILFIMNRPNSSIADTKLAVHVS